MKTEATGVNAAAQLRAKSVSARNAVAKDTNGKKADVAPQGARVKDTVSLSKASLAPVALAEVRQPEKSSSGDYSAKIQKIQKIQGKRVQDSIRPMSDLKNKADERLKQFGSESDTVESVSELNLEDDRKDMVEIAKLRVRSGFYDRPDVIDEIARRIIEGV